jgi:hypothetical protein
MLRFALELIAPPADSSDSPAAAARPAEARKATGRCRISGLGSQIAALIPSAESCWRQIRAWPESLQNTDIRRHRYLTDQNRRRYPFARRAAAFQRQMRGRFQHEHPDLFPRPEEPGAVEA